MATPESADAVFPRSHGAAFEQKRGKFKPADLSKPSDPAIRALWNTYGENHPTHRVPVTSLAYSFLLTE